MEYLSSILPILLLSFISFLVISFTKRSKSHSKKLPPGPHPFPILGNLMKLLSNPTKPHRTLAELANTYGPIMSFKFGSLTTIVISSSTLTKQALQKNHLTFSTPYILEAVRSHQHDQFSVGWLPASTPKWRALRRIYSKCLFSDKMLEAMQARRSQKLEELLGYLRECSKDGVAIDVWEVVFDASFNIMCKTLFSIDLGDDERAKEIKDLMDCIIIEVGRPNIVDFYPFLRIIDPQGINRRLTNFSKKLIKLFDELIDSRLKWRKDNQENHSFCSDSKNDDLLDSLIDVMEEQRDDIGREEIHHLLMDVFGAGMDTTTKSIDWAMAELLRNPSILSKAQEEIDKVITKGEIAKESEVSQLPYLQAIVKETLRLHPPAPLLLPRKVEQDTEIGSFIVPKGAQVIVNAWAIGRDPNTWGDDPDSFNPERFIGSEVDVKGQHFELIPFGAGRRICPGLPFAMRMVPVMLASMIGSFDWKCEDIDDLKEDLDLDDKYEITIKKVKPMRAFPIIRQ